MAAELKPYPTYKDSGVEWLGEVPTHWEACKLRSVLTKVTERNRPDLPLLSVVRERGVILRDVTDMEENHNFIPDDLTNYKVVHEGQFAMNKMKAWQGSYGVSRQEGIVSPAYFIFDINGVTGDYFHVAVRSKAYVPFFTQASDGVRIGQWDLSQARMREVPFLVPPLPEQTAIVRFLDHADRRIRRHIRAKQKLIALLEEQKQAIIHQAVTGQIDVRTGQPYPAYKPSGVEWLGDVPAHWDVLPLKRAFISMDYGISDTGTDEGTIPVLTMGDIRDGTVTVPEYGGVTSVVPNLLLQDKDLLFNRTNSAELVAKVGLFRSGRRPVTFASYLVRMRARQDNKPEFLNFLLNDVGFVATARREAIPSLHQSNLNPTRYGRLPILLPPTPEQKVIVEFVEDSISDVDAALARANRQIEFLHEYRTRLIADVVTGKLDVREVAAALPEVDPLAAEDTLNDTLDTAAQSDLDESNTTLEEVDA